MPKATKKLTETAIARAQLRPEQKQTILWDTAVTGLGVRILPSGSKTFWLMYRPHGGGRAVTARMVRIGASPEVSLADARKAARSLAGAIARGEDPAAERAETRRAAASTLRTLLAENGEYERHLKRRRIINQKAILSGLRRGLAAYMGKDVAAITRANFVTAITAIEDQGKPGAAIDLRKFSRTFCEWAVQRGLAQANVMAGLQLSRRSRAEKLAAEERQARALNDAEILAVWNACEGRGSFGNVMRVLLLTGARRGEIAKLTRDHILTDRIVLPPLHTKSGEQHDVPITEMMRAVIAAQPAAPSALVFPSEKTGRVITGWTRAVDALQRASGVAFTPHDLRRTCRTLMSRRGVEHDIAELAIGHKRTGLARLYNFDEAWQLRGEAFAKVSDHVARVVDQGVPDNVVALPASR